MRTLIFALLIAAAALGGCGKSGTDGPKTAADLKAEREEATKKSRENPVFGTQLQALDKAKGVQDMVNKQTEDAKAKIDEQTK